MSACSKQTHACMHEEERNVRASALRLPGIHVNSCAPSNRGGSDGRDDKKTEGEGQRGRLKLCIVSRSRQEPLHASSGNAKKRQQKPAQENRPRNLESSPRGTTTTRNKYTIKLNMASFFVAGNEFQRDAPTSTDWTCSCGQPADFFMQPLRSGKGLTANFRSQKCSFLFPNGIQVKCR